ncbi:MAG: hypothetical protein K9G44_00925 [Melioribacteraceae bacterium]|nr:hypothetical protein [Melioribacteraceae bacterium]
MYTSYIGKKFLRYYNEKENKRYKAREFFDEVMFPIFFDDERHLLHVGNSAFFQRPSKKFLDESSNKSMAQLRKLHYDIENEEPNMATMVGFAAKDVKGTTSGQITEMDFKIDEDEMYASWIGQSLGLGVSGGFVIAIDDPQVLYNIQKGVKYYREYLSKTPNVKDKQIETWNGHWLQHYYSKNFDPEAVWINFDLETKSTNSALSIPTIRWSRLIFTIAKIFPTQEITVYAYNLSQTNTTLGFIKIYLPQIRRLYELRDALFFKEAETNLSDNQIEFLEPFFGFKSVCKAGSIGLNSIEPKGLRDYLPIGSYKYSRGKDLKISEKNYTTYLIYKLWVIAMLKKTELLKLAERFAKILVGYKFNNSEVTRGKTSKSRDIIDLLDSKNSKQFIENLTALMNKYNGEKVIFKNIVEEVLLMPVDNFPLFVTLIKFEYHYQKSEGE